MRQQRGIALITVLLLLAMMVVIATEMTTAFNLSMRRTENQIYSQNAKLYAWGAERFADAILRQALQDDDVVHLGQSWATKGMVFPLEGGSIQGDIRDLQSCFNLNVLVKPNTLEGQPPIELQQLTTLLQSAGLESYQAEQIAFSARDWVDENDNFDGSTGAEDSIYAGRAVPHLAANAPMIDVSEVRALEGVDRVSYQLIKPYLCTLPTAQWQLNVNTVPLEQPALLEALFTPWLSADQALSLLESRPPNGWRTVDEFLATPEMANIKLDDARKQQITVKSRFFALNAIATYDETPQALYSAFKVTGKNQLTVIARHYGGVQ